jgi:hypothetical protein
MYYVSRLVNREAVLTIVKTSVQDRLAEFSPTFVNGKYITFRLPLELGPELRFWEV